MARAAIELQRRFIHNKGGGRISIKNQVRIGDRLVGRGCPPFIIAEAGINHNGDLETAYSMIREAKRAGADAIKFQTFKADEFVGDPKLNYTYKSQGKEVTESMLEMFKRYEFKSGEWFLIKDKCKEEGIMFLSTPQNLSDLDLLLEVGVPAVKVGSDDLTNLPLLRSYAETELPMLVSCGMSDLSEIYQALEAVGTLDGYPTVLMLCTSQYPTSPEDVNLLKLKALASAFPMAALGFSDHTVGSMASSVAVALGAVVFEKHFTLSHDMPGPDHWFSEDPGGLKDWACAIREAFVVLGNGIVRPTKGEAQMRILARRSIVAISDIDEGAELSVHNIGLRRPGNGLGAGYYELVLGRKAVRRIPRNAHLRWGDIM